MRYKYFFVSSVKCWLDLLLACERLVRKLKYESTCVVTLYWISKVFHRFWRRKNKIQNYQFYVSICQMKVIKIEISSDIFSILWLNYSNIGMPLHFFSLLHEKHSIWFFFLLCIEILGASNIQFIPTRSISVHCTLYILGNSKEQTCTHFYDWHPFTYRKESN